jgi:hypothetical protein
VVWRTSNNSLEEIAVKLLATSLFVLATGCIQAPGDSSSAGPKPGSDDEPSSSPRVALLLTDAPGDFEHVWTNIASVQIGSEDGWLTLVDEPQTFDLLTLQNGVTAALGDAVLAPGHYTQLRLIVDEASVVVDGTESPLTIASGAETGIKIDLDAALEENMEYSLTIDFDAHKSVKKTGAGYLMTPVIMVKELVGTPMPEDSEQPEQPDPEPEPAPAE